MLRVLQERVIERLGGGTPVKVDVRIVAATNRNLERAVQERTFREDLFYRLNVFPIVIPPLRERMDDLPALIWTFIDEYAAAYHKPIDSISKESLAALRQYNWPGNVRELRNVIERAVIVAKGHRLTVEAAVIVRGGATEHPTRRFRGGADQESDAQRRLARAWGRRRGGTPWHKAQYARQPNGQAWHRQAAA